MLEPGGLHQHDTIHLAPIQGRSVALEIQDSSRDRRPHPCQKEIGVVVRVEGDADVVVLEALLQSDGCVDGGGRGGVSEDGDDHSERVGIAVRIWLEEVGDVDRCLAFGGPHVAPGCTGALPTQKQPLSLIADVDAVSAGRQSRLNLSA